MPGNNYDIFKKPASKHKEKISNFAVNRDHCNQKYGRTRVVSNTCRYSSGHLIPMIQSVQG